MLNGHSILQATHLQRTFDHGRFVAVEDVSLTIAPGTIHALLGPNGAGKTTTVRMCATLLQPTGGTIAIDGIDAIAHPGAARRRLGLMLGGNVGFYPRATAQDNLLFFADLYGVHRRRRRTCVREALERVGLLESATQPVQSFSTGMRQRLHLARAVLGSPALVLLDEPTSGLDPDVALSVRDLIQGLADDGVGVLLTSHFMGEVEELADAISLMGAGRIVASGRVEDIANYAGIGGITTCVLPAEAGRLDAALQARLPGAPVVRQRASSSRWQLTVYWPSSRNQPGEHEPQTQPHGKPRPSGIDERNLRANEEEFRQTLRALEAPEPEYVMSRPASLEEAYLAVAERLAR